MIEGKIIFKDNLGEQQVVEHLLNLKSTGYNPDLFLILYAFFKGWHLSKLIYYGDLLEETK